MTPVSLMNEESAKPALPVKYGLLAIRADASARIGIGHLMRCKALGRAWKARGGEILFLSRCDSRDLIEGIHECGFRFVRIEEGHPSPSDIETTLSLLKEMSSKGLAATWVILDGYHFDSSYQRAIHEGGHRVMVIDDYCHLAEYRCDLLLNHNIYADSLQYPLHKGSRCLLGAKYALLGPEFRRRPGDGMKMPAHGNKVLISLGGADPEDVTSKILKALYSFEEPDIELKVIVGPANPRFREIEDAAHSAPFRVEILGRVKDMPELMSWCDVAITGGGGTCLELFYTGVPFMTVVLSENQRPGAEWYAKRKLAINLGWHADLTSENIASVLRALLHSQERRETFSRAGRALVDGLGANRVVEALLPCRLALRDLSPEDCRLVWEWANDPYTRAMSFSSGSIPFESHRSWFKERILNQEKPFFIAVNQNGIPMGYARFEYDDSAFCISVDLSHEFRGIGIGSNLIRDATRKCIEKRKCQRIDALLKVDNIPSIHAFRKAGYRKVRNEVFKGCDIIRMAYEEGAAP